MVRNQELRAHQREWLKFGKKPWLRGGCGCKVVCDVHNYTDQQNILLCKDFKRMMINIVIEVECQK